MKELWNTLSLATSEDACLSDEIIINTSKTQSEFSFHLDFLPKGIYFIQFNNKVLGCKI